MTHTGRYLFFSLLGMAMLLPVTVFAARSVPGEIPKVEPLQVFDPSSRPNVSQNIQASPETVRSDVENSAEDVSTTEQQSEGISAPQSAETSSPEKKGSRLGWWLLGVGACMVVISGIFYYGKKK